MGSVAVVSDAMDDDAGPDGPEGITAGGPHDTSKR
jgi:hypothetical protein